MPPPLPMTPREKCHHGIRHLFSAGLTFWLRKHPDLLIKVKVMNAAGDEEEKDPAEEFHDFQMKLMLNVLDIIDGYDLAPKPEKGPTP